jgi:hypothetical protein
MSEQPSMFPHRCPTCGAATSTSVQPLPALNRDVAPIGRRPDTSRRAAARALPRTGTKRARTLDLIATRGGLTCDELEQITGWTHQSASPTLTTLRDDGWIRDSGHRRQVAHSGNDAVVWILTDRATHERKASR